MKKKTFTLFLALALVFAGIIGGTLAWLTDTTDAVVNTFTDSDIDITLTETGAVNNHNSYKMVPGYTISKDPKVTVEAGSEKCYLFVKLEKSANFDNFLTYEIADGWTALTDVNNDSIADDGVYYRIVETTGMGTAYSVLKNDQVTVKGTVTKEMMSGLTTDTYPTLKVTAYASQFNKNATETFTVNEAWTNVSSNSGN
ncbi:MAG: SipW-dependent-type signal peptide-containing protein [Clostridiales bacterium]|nr:SipW-dependent-type signal peptide-containing protein [Clostridiales bacterium]